MVNECVNFSDSVKLTVAERELKSIIVCVLMNFNKCVLKIRCTLS